jgi:hypothetical protein
MDVPLSYGSSGLAMICPLRAPPFHLTREIAIAKLLDDHEFLDRSEEPLKAMDTIFAAGLDAGSDANTTRGVRRTKPECWVEVSRVCGRELRISKSSQTNSGCPAAETVDL